METLKEQFLTLSIFIDTSDDLKKYNITSLLSEIDSQVRKLEDKTNAAKLRYTRLNALLDEDLKNAKIEAKNEEEFEIARNNISATLQNAEREYDNILLKLKLALEVSLYYNRISAEFRDFYAKVSASNDQILHYTSKVLVIPYLTHLFPRDSEAEAIDDQHLIVRKFYRVEKKELHINSMFMDYIINRMFMDYIIKK